MLHIAAELNAKSYVTWRHVADIASKLMSSYDVDNDGNDNEEEGGEEEEDGEEDEEEIDDNRKPTEASSSSSSSTTSSSSSSSSTPSSSSSSSTPSSSSSTISSPSPNKLSFAEIYEIAQKSLFILLKLKPEDVEVALCLSLGLYFIASAFHSH